MKRMLFFRKCNLFGHGVFRGKRFQSAQKQIIDTKLELSLRAEMSWKVFVGISLLLLTVLIVVYMCLVSLCPRDLSIYGLAIDLVAAIVLAIPMLKSLYEIGRESTSIDGFNVYLAESMIKDRAITLIGLLLLSVGFLFQLVSILKPS